MKLLKELVKIVEAKDFGDYSETLEWDGNDNIVSQNIKFPFAPHPSRQKAIIRKRGVNTEIPVPREIAEILPDAVEEPKGNNAKKVYSWIKKELDSKIFK